MYQPGIDDRRNQDKSTRGPGKSARARGTSQVTDAPVVHEPAISLIGPFTDQSWTQTRSYTSH